ncbi:hypothetical protein Ade02nite_46340 [Paractinoplanes deccanensis]|uniref:Uncharacterized protein n=1 Tax=Paractinoplanes deccanensis TaxID=113561 RepID=A0ABQ3Y7N2_9ACTN|nr:family 43 glycosylhydrolase [Actinoplanes deccanensis]GID75993.1 hypothetical protein Ade02nite_46340 [Actinoplanes deccanensis]
MAALPGAAETVVHTGSGSANCCNVWAPSLHKIGSRWYLYYSAGPSACCDGQRSYVLQRNGVTYLTFSASSCNTPDYKLGMLTLTGSNPLAASSWTKKSTPIFQRSDANGVYGVGGQGFFHSPDGSETWLVYHANETTAQGYRHPAMDVAGQRLPAVEHHPVASDRRPAVRLS